MFFQLDRYAYIQTFFFSFLETLDPWTLVSVVSLLCYLPFSNSSCKSVWVSKTNKVFIKSISLLQGFTFHVSCEETTTKKKASFFFFFFPQLLLKCLSFVFWVQAANCHRTFHSLPLGNNGYVNVWSNSGLIDPNTGAKLWIYFRYWRGEYSVFFYILEKKLYVGHFAVCRSLMPLYRIFCDQ